MSIQITPRRVDTFYVQPASSESAEILQRGRHALVAVSPFNSRFSDDYVERLVGWTRATFDDFDVLLAGDEAACLLEATGTPRGRAVRKARKAVSRNRRTAERALAVHGVRGRNRIHTFSDYVDSEEYRELRRRVDAEFRSDPSFREACLQMSHAAVAGRMQAVDVTAETASLTTAETAVPYVLVELPFFLASTALLQVEESVVIYHCPWPLGLQIMEGRFALTIRPEQGYLVVEEVQGC